MINLETHRLANCQQMLQVRNSRKISSQLNIGLTVGIDLAQRVKQRQQGQSYKV